MAWLIPLFLLLLAFVFWRFSWHADDRVAAWARFILAAIFAVIAVAVSIGIAAQ